MFLLLGNPEDVDTRHEVPIRIGFAELCKEHGRIAIHSEIVASGRLELGLFQALLCDLVFQGLPDDLTVLGTLLFHDIHLIQFICKPIVESFGDSAVVPAALVGMTRLSIDVLDVFVCGFLGHPEHILIADHDDLVLELGFAFLDLRFGIPICEILGLLPDSLIFLLDRTEE